MATRICSNAQKLTHDNYALTTVAATKALPAQVTSLFIDNVDAAISVLVSFDAGNTFKTLKSGSQLSIDCDGLKSYQIKSASGTPSVECLYASEA